MATLLDKKVKGRYPFTYVPSGCTDVAATIRRAKARMQAKQDKQQHQVIKIRRSKV